MRAAPVLYSCVPSVLVTISQTFFWGGDGCLNHTISIFSHFLIIEFFVVTSSLRKKMATKQIAKRCEL